MFNLWYVMQKLGCIIQKWRIRNWNIMCNFGCVMQNLCCIIQKLCAVIYITRREGVSPYFSPKVPCDSAKVWSMMFILESRRSKQTTYWWDALQTGKKNCTTEGPLQHIIISITSKKQLHYFTITHHFILVPLIAARSNCFLQHPGPERIKLEFFGPFGLCVHHWLNL